jgi:hypothetical protein
MFLSTASVELVRFAASTPHGATATATWETSLAIGVAFVLMACVAAIVVLVPTRPPGHDSDEEGGSGPGGEGPGPWRPDAPRRPGGDPDWWPEFERQFAAYVLGRSTEAEHAARSGGRRGRPTPASGSDGLTRWSRSAMHADPGEIAVVQKLGAGCGESLDCLILEAASAELCDRRWCQSGATAAEAADSAAASAGGARHPRKDVLLPDESRTHASARRIEPDRVGSYTQQRAHGWVRATPARVVCERAEPVRRHLRFVERPRKLVRPAGSARLRSVAAAVRRPPRSPLAGSRPDPSAPGARSGSRCRQSRRSS